MASIRNPGSIQVQARPVTMTAPSMLENVTGFIGAVGQLGQAFRRISERRNDRRYAEEAAGTARLFTGVDDELGAMKLKVGNDIGAWNETLPPIEERVMKHIEGLTDPRSRKDAHDRWNTLKNKYEDPILTAEGEALEKVRSEAAWNQVAATYGNAGEAGRNVWSEEPKEARSAAQTRTTVMGLYQDPDGPILQGFGPAAAATGATRWVKQFDEGVIHGYLDAQSEKNLAAAIAQVHVAGAPIPGQPGQLAGQGWDASARSAAIQRWTEAKVQADTYREQEKERQETLQTARENEALLEVYRNANAGVPVTEEMLTSLPNAKTELAARKALTQMNGLRTGAQATALVEATVAAELVVSRTDLTEPGSYGILDALHTQALRNPELHVQDVAKVSKVYTDAMDKVRSYPELPAAEQRLEKARMAWDRIMPGDVSSDTGKAKIAAIGGYDLLHVQHTDKLVREMIAHPGIDETAAVRIGRVLLDLGKGRSAEKLGILLKDPKTAQIVRSSPYKLLEGMPSVQHESIRFVEGTETIDMGATVEALRLHYATQGIDPMSSQAKGYEETVGALLLLGDEAVLELHVDPAEDLKQEIAVAEEEAAQAAATARAETPVGRRRQRRNR